MPPFADRARLEAEGAALGALIGVVSGLASALFLALLDRATAYRESHRFIVYALPLAGVAIGLVYQRLGSRIRSGQSLIIDTLHDDGPELPLRMAPMVLVGTVLTHLFGGSAGREGTAVQMGASLADFLTHRLGLRPLLRRPLLAAGVAGGFGSVFGTPLAGAVFALEFVVVGRIEHRALLPALAASVVGDLTTRACGITHTAYPTLAHVALTPMLLLRWIAFGLVVAAVSAVFVELTHAVKAYGERRLPLLPLRALAGGVAVVSLTMLVGTHDYLGLGIPTILRAFDDPSLPAHAFALKVVFTAITVGCGFIGGEVTPLFFVGATLGNVLARLLDIPLDLGAGVGLVAVFATAANTPIALTLMAVEILGAGVLPHAAVVCAVAFAFAGPRGIYPTQRRPAGAQTGSGGTSTTG